MRRSGGCWWGSQESNLGASRPGGYPGGCLAPVLADLVPLMPNRARFADGSSGLSLPTRLPGAEALGVLRGTVTVLGAGRAVKSTSAVMAVDPEGSSWPLPRRAHAGTHRLDHRAPGFRPGPRQRGLQLVLTCFASTGGLEPPGSKANHLARGPPGVDPRRCLAGLARRTGREGPNQASTLPRPRPDSIGRHLALSRSFFSAPHRVTSRDLLCPLALASPVTCCRYVVRCVPLCSN